MLHVEFETALLKNLLERCKNLYLPNMLYALVEAGISRVVLRKISPDLYERYEEHYRSQATATMEYRSAEAFRGLCRVSCGSDLAVG